MVSKKFTLHVPANKMDLLRTPALDYVKYRINDTQDHVWFYGGIGSGKTTSLKLAVKSLVKSPRNVIVTFKGYYRGNYVEMLHRQLTAFGIGNDDTPLRDQLAFIGHHHLVLCLVFDDCHLGNTLYGFLKTMQDAHLGFEDLAYRVVMAGTLSMAQDISVNVGIDFMQSYSLELPEDEMRSSLKSFMDPAPVDTLDSLIYQLYQNAYIYHQFVALLRKSFNDFPRRRFAPSQIQYWLAQVIDQYIFEQLGPKVNGLQETAQKTLQVLALASEPSLQHICQVTQIDRHNMGRQLMYLANEGFVTLPRGFRPTDKYLPHIAVAVPYLRSFFRQLDLFPLDYQEGLYTIGNTQAAKDVDDELKSDESLKKSAPIISGSPLSHDEEAKNATSDSDPDDDPNAVPGFENVHDPFENHEGPIILHR